MAVGVGSGVATGDDEEKKGGRKLHARVRLLSRIAASQTAKPVLCGCEDGILFVFWVVRQSFL